MKVDSHSAALTWWVLRAGGLSLQITTIPKQNREPSRTDAQPNGTLASYDTVNGARAPLRVRALLTVSKGPTDTRRNALLH